MEFGVQLFSRCQARSGEVIAAIERSAGEFGDFEHASLQVNFNMMPLPAAQASMRLFSA